MTGAVLRERTALALRQAVGLLCLVVLGCAASMAVGAFMFVMPSVFQSGCGEGTRFGNVLLHGSDFAADRCEWEHVLKELAPAKGAKSAHFRRSVELREGIAGTLHIRLSADVPPASALAQRVRRGQAAVDVSSFVRTVWGVLVLGRTEPVWQLPDLTADQLLNQATVTVSGTAQVPSGDLVLYSRGPTSLRMTLRNSELRAVDTVWHLAAQGTHTLSADTGKWGEMLKVAMAPADAAAPRRDFPGDGPMGSWLPATGQYVAQAGRVLAATGRALLAAAGWCALLLAYRNGALAPLVRSDGIPQLIRIAGAVVMVHVILSVVPWIDLLVAGAADSLGHDFFASVGLWLGWNAAGYAALPISLVLLVAGILIVLPRTVRALADSRPALASCTTVRTGTAVRWLLLSCLLAVVGAAVLCWLIALQRVPVSWTDAASAFGFLLVLALALGTVSWGCGAVAHKAGWRIQLSSLLWASAWVPLITVAAAIHSTGGVLPVALRWAGSLVVGTAAVLATGCVAWRATTHSRPSRTGVFVLLAVAVALAVSWNRDEPLSPGWWDLQGLARQLDGVLGLVLVAATVRALYDCGQSPLTVPRELRGHRALGIVLMFTLAAGGLSLLAVPSWVTACSAALMAWFLFPYEQIKRAAAVLRQAPGEHTDAVNRSAQSGAARRALSSLRKAAHEKIADGRPGTVVQRRLRAVERSSYDERRRDQAGGTVSVRQLAFGAYTGAVPWQRALRTAQAAAVIGAPWTVLSLAGAVVAAHSESKYPVLDIVGTAAPILLFWAGYGLLYGYFFPLLRGQTGLAKALWTYGLMLVPAVLQVAVSRDPAHWASWTHTLLYALQAFTFAMTLGLCADGAVLAKNRMRPARLTDIHNLGFIAAWWSSVAIALVTGVATAIVAGLQPFLIDLLPKTPEAPAVSTTPSEAPDGR
ncbi:hypothetical protein ABZ128_08855 [Streptomyces sp. NPDC006326]|uniref:hypothetical protein n=1 Tax=Streptomyces sp. NPDC006326 TaxID=3156752 RepID=UPI0033AEE2AE